ncbi:hypothetical protein DICSQDRAFT_157088 [Dichomitus squalens LYAD-421 SS1]|uniref:F-box domain-containing protein n=1 Tax=Dichomitus squalens (strain LYAD-421) TaxID=732165 RepID=R7SPD4_DICSQ|nr:uncharacterized protein DICSQDRAFT_157088 [Dichomitus squalens LYAD-421 SS1]EJF57961.1 hypothetical protein DICSQDRAFT_157088 [Dichomitus squalens LYAD-421 SS1]
MPVWKDPMIRHWQSLKLASCPKLDSIRINIYLRARPTDDDSDETEATNVPALSLPGAGMLFQASSALRSIYIYVHDLPRVTTLNDRRLLRLQEFDKVITPDTFPLLLRVFLRIRPDGDLWRQPDYKWRKVVVGTRRALPNLHSRGMLRV